MPAVILAKLEDARRDLLDLTTRNRLINTPISSKRARLIRITDELSAEVFRLLVGESKSMSFDPQRVSEDDEEFRQNSLALALPAVDVETKSNERATAKRHSDRRLQTSLSPEALQRRLLALYRESRSALEEHGVNVLFIAIGFLEWYEAESSDTPRYAPLLLVPCELNRKDAKSRFELSFTGEELSTNLSLKEQLLHDFGIEFPELFDEEELDLNSYFNSVAHAIRSQTRWQVLRDEMVLGLYSFSKFLMYRDLGPEQWAGGAGLGDHPILRWLLGGEPKVDESSIPADDDLIDVDELIDPRDQIHVLDADSSQAIALERALNGNDLVIEGPPGTGKSQTIANLLAAAIYSGKKVLFLAEKQVALEVVRRRLTEVGLGDTCLELHSHKARKKTVLEDLRYTLELGRPKDTNNGSTVERLREQRDLLNEHVRFLHTPHQPTGLTPYRVMGELVRLGADGLKPPDFRLEGELRRTPDQRHKAHECVATVATVIDEIGTPAEHPWRGVALETILPPDVDRFRQLFVRLAPWLGEWADEVSELGEMLACECLSFEDMRRMVDLCRWLEEGPRLDLTALASAEWESRLAEIEQLVRDGAALSISRQVLSGTVRQEAWDQDFQLTRDILEAHGHSLLRFFRSDYRQSMRTLRGALTKNARRSFQDRLEILCRLSYAQHLRSVIGEAEPLGRNAFGSLWLGEDSDWASLETVVQWVSAGTGRNLPDGFRQIGSRIHNREEIAQRAKVVGTEGENILRDCKTAIESVELDCTIAFGSPSLEAANIQQLAERASEWAKAPQRIREWIRYRELARRSCDLGLSELVERLFDGRVAPADAVGVYEYASYEMLLRAFAAARPDFAAFSGRLHDDNVRKFSDLDRARIDLARREVASAHFESIPRGAGSYGELGIVLREINKKKRHLPIRQLLKRAGSAVQQIKPIFMMSPMSVAQFLEPGRISFDMLVIDEASQVSPVDAFGAIARVQQAVIVGDDRQLPPTRFFDKIIDDGLSSEDEEYQSSARDIESILGMCRAAQFPVSMLRWHYRSRHESLVAVSNHLFYNDRLFIVPSPHSKSDEGVSFHFVENAIYDRGKSHTNAVEAEVVACHVMDHARERPDLTLGVAAFSVAQRNAILDYLELMRRESPETEEFFRPSRIEPFFVKNLESVQGDERDVIFISVGYGRDASGFFAMNFGPLNAEGGERRLNVLTTRARRQCHVFTSIRHHDIDLGRTQAAGVVALQTYLRYAESRVLDVVRPGARGPDSVFEEQVARALSHLGHDVDHQVGTAGFFIDLAVRDPKRAGSYVLGIECDGRSYHSARWARDRDRLRQQVLEDHGWTIHRIWSTDWFNDPDKELRKVHAAIGRVSGESDSPAVLLGGFGQPTVVAIDRHEPEQEQSPVKPYREADFHVIYDEGPHEIRLKSLLGIVERIVDLEGPIHVQEIARRVAACWGLQRAGSRIREVTKRAADLGVRRGVFLAADGFVQKPETRVYPRNRSSVQSSTLRKPDMLPPQEIRAAVGYLVSGYVGMSAEEVASGTARLLGFQRAGGEIAHVIMDEIRRMLYDDVLSLQEGRVYLVGSEGD